MKLAENVKENGQRMNGVGKISLCMAVGGLLSIVPHIVLL